MRRQQSSAGAFGFRRRTIGSPWVAFRRHARAGTSSCRWISGRDGRAGFTTDLHQPDKAKVEPALEFVGCPVAIKAVGSKDGPNIALECQPLIDASLVSPRDGADGNREQRDNFGGRRGHGMVGEGMHSASAVMVQGWRQAGARKRVVAFSFQWPRRCDRTCGADGRWGQGAFLNRRDVFL